MPTKAQHEKLAIGLDLSLTGTGVVVVGDKGFMYERLIKSKPTKSGSPRDELIRIRNIVEEIRVIIAVPQAFPLVAIEGLAFSARNTSALVQLAALNYMTRDMLFDLGVPFVIVAPTTLKKYITGKGNAPKDIIMLEIYKKYGISIMNNNTADAYVLGRCALALLGRDEKHTKEEKEVLSLLSAQIA